MTEKEKMLAGELYVSSDMELWNERKRAQKYTRLYNQTTEEDFSYRQELLKELFSETGEMVYIEPPFRCDYGSNISVGENFYANYDCIILDVCKVTIGDNALLAPRVGIYTATHPIDPKVRTAQLEFGKPITIGDNVWIGADVSILPGVTIGDNVVIGAGSVVTKDIPSDVVAAGNPCKVIKND